MQPVPLRQPVLPSCWLDLRGPPVLLIMQGWAGLILLGSFVTSSLAGGWSDEDDEMDCQGDVCFEKYQYLKTAKNNVAGGLKYQEKLSARAESRDLVSVCLPSVNEKFVAFMFNSCSEKKGAGAEVCLVQKRGWLKSNGKHLVPNKEDLLSNLAALPGGDEAVRTCLELAPEYQYEQYEIYDYADYGADWDYLEESGARAVRKRRAAAKDEKKKLKKGDGRKKMKTKKPKRGGRKGKRTLKKKGDKPKARQSKGDKKPAKSSKGDNKKGGRPKKPKKKKNGNGKKEKSYGKSSGRRRPKQKDNNKKENKKDKKERKAEKAADRKAAKDEKADKAEKPEKQSGVSKATMSQLSCVEERIAELLAACGEKLLGSKEV